MRVEAPPGTIHATAVAVGKRGILIRGPAGSGKSSLALALIDDPRLDARLVADDRVVLSDNGADIVAAAPPQIAGLIEVRGIGIVPLDFVPEAVVALVVDLLPLESCPRFPETDDRQTVLAGRQVARLALPIGAPDAPLRVRLALQAWTAAD